MSAYLCVAGEGRAAKAGQDHEDLSQLLLNVLTGPHP